MYTNTEATQNMNKIQRSWLRLTQPHQREEDYMKYREFGAVNHFGVMKGLATQKSACNEFYLEVE